MGQLVASLILTLQSSSKHPQGQTKTLCIIPDTITPGFPRASSPPSSCILHRWFSHYITLNLKWIMPKHFRHFTVSLKFIVTIWTMERTPKINEILIWLWRFAENLLANCSNCSIFVRGDGECSIADGGTSSAEVDDDRSHHHPYVQHVQITSVYPF